MPPQGEREAKGPALPAAKGAKKPEKTGRGPNHYRYWMQSRAAFKVALKHLRRENHVNIIRKKSIILALATVLMLGSFFQSLFWIISGKTSLSAFSNQPHPDFIDYISQPNPLVKPAFAKSLPQSILDQEPLEDVICQSETNSSKANPALDELKKDQLCLALAIQEDPDPAWLALEESTNPSQEALKNDLQTILVGTPMEPMIDSISQQDRTVAAFLVGIANKESTLGRFAPRKNGRDCFNYWGYKGNIDPVAGGYACFGSREQAVETVGTKIGTYVAKGRSTPGNFTMWKCGSSCAGHSPESVSSWVTGVSKYFYQLEKPKKS